ncbi:hypothetical protein BLOT_000183 [Blomia tropicalis]|nr:hypothetical protein BLOT_000183 [Blomia tropicalis]
MRFCTLVDNKHQMVRRSNENKRSNKTIRWLFIGKLKDCNYMIVKLKLLMQFFLFTQMTFIYASFHNVNANI